MEVHRLHPMEDGTVDAERGIADEIETWDVIVRIDEMGAVEVREISGVAVTGMVDAMKDETLVAAEMTDAILDEIAIWEEVETGMWDVAVKGNSSVEVTGIRAEIGSLFVEAIEEEMETRMAKITGEVEVLEEKQQVDRIIGDDAMSRPNGRLIVGTKI